MSEVTCPNCQRVNRASNAFCTGCGTGLTTGEVPAGEMQGEAGAERQTQEFRAEIAAVRNQLRDTGTLLNHLQTRIFQLERGLSAPVQRLTTVDDPQPDTPDRQTETGSSQASDAPVQEPVSHESPSPRLSEYYAPKPVTAGQAPPANPSRPEGGRWRRSGEFTSCRVHHRLGANLRKELDCNYRGRDPGGGHRVLLETRL